MRASLAKVGELAFVDAIAKLAGGGRPQRGVVVGVGDDAAVVATGRRTVVTTDAQVENVHFRAGWLSARELGRRAFRVAVSDIAAMGARLDYLLLSLVLPGDYSLRDGRALVGGFANEARTAGAALVGGNVAGGEAVSVTVTAIGEAPSKPALRSGARAGDALFVTGTLGDAAAGVELLLRGEDRGSLVRAYRRPPLRLDVAGLLQRSGCVRAMIDVSDGVVQDLERLCRASGVSVELDIAALPLSGALRRAALERPALDYALGGGDDYELLFAARGGGARLARLEASCAELGCMLSRVGRVIPAKGPPVVVDADGKRLVVPGFTHFGAES